MITRLKPSAPFLLPHTLYKDRHRHELVPFPLLQLDAPQEESLEVGKMHHMAVLAGGLAAVRDEQPPKINYTQLSSHTKTSSNFTLLRQCLLLPHTLGPPLWPKGRTLRHHN
jgi:hypothetical protein